MLLILFNPHRPDAREHPNSSEPVLFYHYSVLGHISVPVTFVIDRYLVSNQFSSVDSAQVWLATSFIPLISSFAIFEISCSRSRWQMMYYAELLIYIYMDGESKRLTMPTRKSSNLNWGWWPQVDAVWDDARDVVVMLFFDTRRRRTSQFVVFNNSSIEKDQQQKKKENE